jgi:hypothetical protein
LCRPKFDPGVQPTLLRFWAAEEGGVITMAMIGKVLRMHHRDSKSAREIAEATSLSRNTVRKYLRGGAGQAPRYRRAAMPTKLPA